MYLAFIVVFVCSVLSLLLMYRNNENCSKFGMLPKVILNITKKKSIKDDVYKTIRVFDFSLIACGDAQKAPNQEIVNPNG